MAERQELELVHGGGNVFRDFDDPDADVKQSKGILDDRGPSTRKAQALTGVDQAHLARIGNAKLDRFAIDRLTTIVNRLDYQVNVRVEVRPAMAHV
jgi:predicted XRE-type DNA-binding protein